jgi:hypothetical protein
MAVLVDGVRVDIRVLSSPPEIDPCVLAGGGNQGTYADDEEISTPPAVDSAVVGDADGVG